LRFGKLHRSAKRSSCAATSAYCERTESVKVWSNDETTIREGPLFHGRNWVARLLEVVLETTGSEHRRLLDGVEPNVIVRADTDD
jgi:hypothetical protein